jgi:hypothetical protein
MARNKKNLYRCRIDRSYITEVLVRADNEDEAQEKASSGKWIESKRLEAQPFEVVDRPRLTTFIEAQPTV